MADRLVGDRVKRRQTFDVVAEVLGRPVELVIVDNKSDKVESANAVKRLTAKDKVTGIIGSYGSSLSMAGGEVSEQAKTPAIATRFFWP